MSRLPVDMAQHPPFGGLPFPRGTRYRRYIHVEVWIDDHQQDCFDTGSATTLVRLLRSIERHMPEGRGRHLFFGIDEGETDLGLRRWARSVQLPGSEAAVEFLCGDSAGSREAAVDEGTICTEAMGAAQEKMDAA